MKDAAIPLLILGGSDRKPAQLPPKGHGKHPLSGCKGVDVRIGGRCMIHVLIERLQKSGSFAPIYIAGPEPVYESVGTPVPIIDTNAGFGRNIQVGLETVMKHHPEGPIGISTCDILPDGGELRSLVADYRSTAPSDLWFPVIRAPEDPQALGASAWKPQYYIVPEPGQSKVRVLPGHLTIFNPKALRLIFLYRLFDLAYSTRNRPILYRRSYILRQVIVGLLAQDVYHLLGLKLPTVTWDVVRYGVAGARKLRKGTITRRGLEDVLRRVFVRRRHRLQYPKRRILLPIMDALSVARDIDTEEEAAAIGGISG